MSEKPMHPRKRILKVVTECQQIIIDCEYWNSINPTKRPIEFEDVRVFLGKAKSALTAFDRGELEASERLMSDALKYGEENGWDLDEPPVIQIGE